MSAPVSLIGELHVADRQFEDDEAYADFRTFFIGALSHLLSTTDGGAEAWHAAIAVAEDAVTAARVLAAAEFQDHADAALALFASGFPTVDELAARRAANAGGTR